MRLRHTKKIIIIIISIIMVVNGLVGCSDHSVFFECGTVIAVEHIPEHKQKIVRPVMLGKMVTLMPIVRKVPETWVATIQYENGVIAQVELSERVFVGDVVEHPMRVQIEKKRLYTINK